MATSVPGCASDLTGLTEVPVPGATRGRVRRRVIWVVIVGVASAAVVPAVVRAVRDEREQRCKSHLRLVAAALQAYHQEFGHFPAPFTADRNGRPLLSWRVAVLPYLGRRDLHGRFRLDEPWDSSHNRALLEEIPEAFVCPGVGGAVTAYQVVVGPPTDVGSVNTPFEPGRGVDVREITDGASNVILVAEADGAVPWTRPIDLAFGKGHPLPTLAGRHAGGSSVVMADGWVRSIRPTALPETVKALYTINGGEVISGGGPG